MDFPSEEQLQASSANRHSSTSSGYGSRNSLRPTSSHSAYSRGSSRIELGVNFVGGLDKSYVCSVCANVLQYPVQFEECGHRVCSSCLSELLWVTPRCPHDQSKVDRKRVYVDKSFLSEIDGLKVKCTNQSRGCQ